MLKGEKLSCRLDNLFISIKFCRKALCKTKQEVVTHGMCRVDGRGLPKSINLKEERTEILKARACDKVKSTVLKGDPQVKYMIAFLVYNTKPVHFISTATKSLKWTEKKKIVYNKATQ